MSSRRRHQHPTSGTAASGVTGPAADDRPPAPAGDGTAGGASARGASADDRRAAGAGDPGLFGPGSVTWRVHAEPVVALAGLRALLLQTLHPLAMAGVDQHSGFRSDPWGRLLVTATYVATTTYGTTDEALALAGRVRRLHERVQGVDPVTGRHYAASDPDLLLWVHCALVDSLLGVARRAGMPLDDGDADRYVREQVVSAEILGVPAGATPTDRAQLADAIAAYRPVLCSSPVARDAVARVLVPPLPALLALTTPVRPLWAGLGGVALASLPRWARRLHALPNDALTDGAVDLAATTALRALRSGAGGLQRLVPALREPPLLREAHQRLGTAAAAGARRTRPTPPTSAAKSARRAP